MTGNRRIDRVLAEDFLTGLSALPIEEVRVLRKEAEQEEVDLSYVRRLLQGRMDILRAERDRRTSGSQHDASIVDSLSRILADDAHTSTSPPYGLGRHAALEPSRVDAHRRRVELLVADVDLSDPAAMSDDALTSALGVLEREEHEVSTQRRKVQQAMDACTTEIGRRYRDGDADVADLLPSGQ